MTPITLLESQNYTPEEREALVDFVLALRKAHIRDLLEQVDLPVSGNKPDLRERIQKALDNGKLSYERLVKFLDSVAPWSKQHVLLFSGPPGDLQSWKDPVRVADRLKQHRLGKLFNAQMPLVLPEKLTLSSITHAEGVLRITAIQKHDYDERTPEHDEVKNTKAGDKVFLRAYVGHQSRTLVAFEWNLEANVAMLQITQLHTDGLYNKVAKEFFDLVRPWMDVQLFAPVDVRRSIRGLHELEGKGSPETRSHGIQYRTLQGRRLAAHSPSPQDSVFGEASIDQAMENVGKNGVGHLGNFYWLPGIHGGSVRNPLTEEVHVIIVGDEARINFTTPNPEGAVRYVLHRVRALS